MGEKIFSCKYLPIPRLTTSAGEASSTAMIQACNQVVNHTLWDLAHSRRRQGSYLADRDEYRDQELNRDK
ncbi:hypothetical protein TNCV_3863711 [Trichonephila clavipes]|uniref:Uncharacterized protein n=1 Tax=Trichonephila clavipes TaxID=2585209 RepID=A0A8X6V5Y3_TRICX|nr:hypothetical protein TNCV_3863711 [Trichonephila clavipes]